MKMSKKTVEIKIILNIFARRWKDPDPYNNEGSRRSKNIRILRIRIYNTAVVIYVPYPTLLRYYLYLVPDRPWSVSWKPVLWIRIRMFLGLPAPDPDPLVRGMDPDPDPNPDPSIIMQK